MFCSRSPLHNQKRIRLNTRKSFEVECDGIEDRDGGIKLESDVIVQYNCLRCAAIQHDRKSTSAARAAAERADRLELPVPENFPMPFTTGGQHMLTLADERDTYW